MYYNLKFFVFSVAVFLSSTLFAQSFLVEIDNPVQTAEMGNEIMFFEINVTNLSSNELTLSFVKTDSEIPENWSCSFCLSVCFQPELDSIATTSEFLSSPLLPGEKRLLVIDVATDTTSIGSATIILDIADVNNHADNYTLNLQANIVLSSVSAPETAADYSLSQNFPNPFNPSTNISFVIPESGNVTLKVYDILGREVAEVVYEYLTAGKHELAFNGSDLPSGVYFYKIKAGNYTNIKKMILEK